MPAPNAILGDIVSSMSLRFWSQVFRSGSSSGSKTSSGSSTSTTTSGGMH